MKQGTKNLIYAICGVVVVACFVYLLFDLHILGGKEKPENEIKKYTQHIWGWEI